MMFPGFQCCCVVTIACLDSRECFFCRGYIPWAEPRRAITAAFSEAWPIPMPDRNEAERGHWRRFASRPIDPASASCRVLPPPRRDQERMPTLQRRQWKRRRFVQTLRGAF